MSKFFVGLSGIDDKKLEFLGFYLVLENEEFKLYRDYAGEEYIVLKNNPYMYVDDPNDAAYLNATKVVIISG